MPDDLHDLQLAFAYHMAVQLVSVDATVEETELSFLADRFPRGDLVAAGILDPNGHPTPRFEDLRDRALVELPEHLPAADKVALLGLIADAGAADGVLSPEEADALSAAARILGVPDAEWLAHVEALIAEGRLARDATGVPSPGIRS